MTGSFFARRLHLEELEHRRLLAITVDTPLDVVNAGDGLTSLREAITTANGGAGAETLVFSGLLSGATINLTGGELEITDELTIDASALASNVTLDAQQASRVLNFSALTGDLSLNSLTITGGRTTGDNTYPGNQTGYEPTFNGGGIRFLSNGTLTITDSTVTGNGTTGLGASGGGIATLEGNVMLFDSVVSGNTTTGIWGRAGGVYAQSGTITIEGSTISGNSTSASGGSGGGIFTLSSDVSLTNSQLLNNKTMFTGPLNNGRLNNGGGISTLRGNVNITDSTVTGNSTAGDSSSGGAIIASDGTVTVTNSDFSNNNTYGAGSGGGAVRAGSNPLEDNAVVIQQGSTFQNNRAAGAGGAISVSGGSITVEDSTLTENEATSGYGGALFLSRGTVTITNSELLNNHSSGGGGAASVRDGSIMLADSTVSDNYTTGSSLFTSGGAIFVRSGDGSVTLLRTKLSNNETRGAQAGGGGIFVLEDVDVVLTQSTVSNNRSMQASGGGISIRDGDLTISESTVSGNSGVIRGGGIHAVAYGAVTITDSTISGNSVTGSTVIGGGLYSRGGTVVIDQSTISGNRTISDGSATPGGTVADSHGGGIALGTGSLMLRSSSVTDNHAEGVNTTGGGIRIINSTASVPATIANSIVAGNTGSSIVFRPSPDFSYLISPDETIPIESSLLGEIDANLLASLTVSNSLIGTLGSPIDPLLGPLANNGGPTQTHALLPGSPAFDAASQVLLHAYDLTQSVDDLKGGPALTALGGSVTAAGYDFGANEGLNLTSPSVDPEDYVIRIEFSLDALTAPGGSTFQKIIDFDELSADAGLYVRNTGSIQFFGPIVSSSTGVITAGTLHELIVSRNGATKEFIATVDGAEAFRFTDSGDAAVFSGAGNVPTFFQDDTAFSETQAEAGPGLVTEIFVSGSPLAGGFDQRGTPFARLVGPSIDIGAYEAQITPSADFDTDGDVDGFDFLAWQRGFGKANAQRADGNSDDDTDTDASDLAAWKTSFGQPLTLVAATSSPESGFSTERVSSDSTTDNTTQLIEAAMIWDLASQTGREADDSEIAKPTAIEAVFASYSDVVEQYPTASFVAEDFSPSTTENNSTKPSDSWLDEELLERVFS